MRNPIINKKQQKRDNRKQGARFFSKGEGVQEMGEAEGREKDWKKKLRCVKDQLHENHINNMYYKKCMNNKRF